MQLARYADADPWTPDEEAVVFEAQRAIGNKWCDIAKMLPGRTENSVKNLWNSHKRRLGRQTTLHPQDLSGNKIPALSSLGASISQEARQRARGVVQAEIEKCPAILLPPKSKGREQKASRKDSNSTHGAAAAHRSLVQAHSAHLTAQARAHRMAIAQHSSASGLRSTRQSTRTSSQQNEATQAHIVHVSAALVAAANRNAAAHLLPGLQSTFTPQPLTAPVTAGTYSQPATLRTVNIAVPSHPAQASAPGGSASGLPEPYSDNEEDDLPSPGSQNNTAHPFFQPTPTLDTHVIRSCSEHKRDSGGVPFLKLPPFAELLDDDAIMVPNGPAITRIPRMSPQGSLAAENSSGGNLGRGRGGTASTHDLDDVQSSVSGSMLDRSDFTRDDGSGVASHQGMLPGEGQRGPPLTEEALASIFHAQLGADNASTTLSRFRPHIEAAADYASGPGDSRLFPAFIASSPPKLLRGAAQLGQLYAAAYNAGFKAGTAVSIEEASFELQLTPTLGSAACKMLAAAQLSRGGWSPSAITEQVQQSLSKPSQAAGDPLGSSSKKSVSPHSSLACSATSPTHCSDTQAQRRGSAGGAPTESPRPFADAIEESAGGNPPTTQDTQQQWGAPQHGTPVSGEGGGGQWQSGHGTGFVVPGIGLQRGALRSASQAAAPCVLGTASSPSDGFAGSFLAVLRTNEASTCTPPTGIPPELSVGLSAPGSPGRGGLGLHKSSALTRSPGTMFLHSPDTLAKGGPPTNEDFGFLPSPAKDAQK